MTAPLTGLREFRQVSPLFCNHILASYATCRGICAGGKFVKALLFRSVAVAALCYSAAADAQTTHALAEDAAAFGAREAVVGAGLSPDGSSVMYLTPGPGPKTYAVISNLQTGQERNRCQHGRQSRKSLQWCKYSGPQRVVCSIAGNVDVTGHLVGFRRLISMTSDGTDAKLLGKPMRYNDASLNSVDARVLDWRGGRDGKILMERVYNPSVGTGTAVEDQPRRGRGRSGGYCHVKKRGCRTSERDGAGLHDRRTRPCPTYVDRRLQPRQNAAAGEIYVSHAGFTRLEELSSNTKRKSSSRWKSMPMSILCTP